MPPELAALIDKPWLLVAVLAVGALLGIAVERTVEGKRRAARRAYWQARRSREAGGSKPVTSAFEQLRIAIAAPYASRPLLNRSEARLFRELRRLVRVRNPEWHVMAQVCVGEFVRSDDRPAHAAINSKRVDLLLVDGDCQARHAVEYQGAGHHRGDGAARDAVKKEALRKAGIGYHEVVAGETNFRDLCALVARIVPQAAEADAALEGGRVAGR